jgi:hypothetical protein
MSLGINGRRMVEHQHKHIFRRIRVTDDKKRVLYYCECGLDQYLSIEDDNYYRDMRSAVRS